MTKMCFDSRLFKLDTQTLLIFRSHSKPNQDFSDPDSSTERYKDCLYLYSHGLDLILAHEYLTAIWVSVCPLLCVHLSSTVNILPSVEMSKLQKLFRSCAYCAGADGPSYFHLFFWTCYWQVLHLKYSYSEKRVSSGIY